MKNALLILIALISNIFADNGPDVDKTPLVPGFKWLNIKTGVPTPGVAVLEQVDFAPYVGTELKHKIILPKDWVAGKKYPVIFEYLGNTGLVATSMGMAYGLNTNGSGFIIVTLPFVNNAYRDTASWWGNVEKTVDYAKKVIPWICKKWGGDSTKLVLMGFSRGAIATNYIGFHDDEIAKFWKATLSFSHYDDMSWKWEMSNAEYNLAPTRLKRMGSIPQLICSEYAKPVGATDALTLILQDSLAAYTSMDKALIDFKLKFKFESEGTKAFIQKNFPAANVTYLGFPYLNHTPNYFMHDIPQRKVALDWLMSALNTGNSSSSSSSSSSVMVSSSSSMTGPVANLQIQPNPLRQSGEAIYNLLSPTRLITFRVFTASGELAREFSEQNARVGKNSTWIKDAHQLPTGAYVLKIMVNGRTVQSAVFRKAP